jgi:hypothetical protein
MIGRAIRGRGRRLGVSLHNGGVREAQDGQRRSFWGCRGRCRFLVGAAPTFSRFDDRDVKATADSGALRANRVEIENEFAKTHPASTTKATPAPGQKTPTESPTPASV